MKVGGYITDKNYLSSVGLTNVWLIWPLSSLITVEIKKKKADDFKRTEGAKRKGITL